MLPAAIQEHQISYQSEDFNTPAMSDCTSCNLSTQISPHTHGFLYACTPDGPMPPPPKKTFAIPLIKKSERVVSFSHSFYILHAKHVLAQFLHRVVSSYYSLQAKQLPSNSISCSKPKLPIEHIIIQTVTPDHQAVVLAHALQKLTTSYSQLLRLTWQSHLCSFFTVTLDLTNY